MSVGFWDLFIPISVALLIFGPSIANYKDELKEISKKMDRIIDLLEEDKVEE